MTLRASSAVRFDALAAATDSLHAAVRDLDSSRAAAERAQRAFADARAAFKRVEYLLEYYMPLAAEQMNGPPLDDVELDEGPTIISPREGFQVLEELLFPEVDYAELAYLRSEAQVLRDHARRPQVLAQSQPMADQHVFDALRIEVARIVTLGITGFDSPVRRASLGEARDAIAGIRDGLEPYRADLARAAPDILVRFDRVVAGAHAALHGDYGAFDRLGFITSYANPLAAVIAAARDSLNVSVPPEPRFWRASAVTLFEPDAFDPDVLRPAWAPVTTPERVVLGERLFFDPALSGSGTRSCATCHLPDRAFTDGQVRSVPLEPGAVLRNAPTLINAALQGAQFADLRTVFLEDQVSDVVTNRAEMHGTLAAAAALLGKDSSYVGAFRAAYPNVPQDSLVVPSRIRNALAAYIRSLVRLDSPLDRALRGDTAALTPEQRLGFNVFAGKGLCATCHFLPLTNGTVPPVFSKTEQEVLGVPDKATWRNARVSADSGRATITRAPLHRFAFKTPSVRNATLTAPYMHNGVYRTLKEVVRFYDVGGGAGIGIELPNQTLPFDSLGLTKTELLAVEAFLHTVTDTTGTTGVRMALAR